MMKKYTNVDLWLIRGYSTVSATVRYLNLLLNGESILVKSDGSERLKWNSISQFRIRNQSVRLHPQFNVGTTN